MKFIEFLTDKYQEERHSLDDNMSDGFPVWYSNKDLE